MADIPNPEGAFTFFFRVMGDVLRYFIKHAALVVIIIAVAAGLYWYFFDRKKRRVNRMEKLKKDLAEISRYMKSTGYPHIKHLQLIPVDLNRIADDEKKELIRDSVAANNAMYTGEITGFNRINLLATSAEVERLSIKGQEGIELTETAKARIHDEVKDTKKKIGSHLYIITYKQKRKRGMFEVKTKEEVLIITENQMISYNDIIGGNVLIEGYGIEPFGCFNIISGHPEIAAYLLTQLEVLTVIDITIAIMGDTRNLVMKGVDADPMQEKQIRMWTALGQAIKTPHKKDE